MPRYADMDKKWDDLEPFTSVGAKFIDPYITINRRGGIILSTGFVKEAHQQIADSKFVILNYSKKADAIALEFTTEKKRRTTITLQIRGNISFTGKSFFNVNKITPNDVQGKYYPKLEKLPKKGSCWVIYLKEKKNS